MRAPWGGAVVVLVEESVEADVEIMEGAEGACEVNEASLPQGCAKKRSIFPRAGALVGLCVQEGSPHPRAGESSEGGDRGRSRRCRG